MRNLRRSLSFILILALCLSLVSVSVLAASPGMANFTEKKTYTEGYFTDIGGKWFEGSVARGYSLGLIDGKGEGIFDYKGNVTLAEAIKLAACIHSIYNTGEANFVQGSPWYQVYVDYCLTKGILSSGYADYKAAATRAQFAQIFASALPTAALPAINTVDDNAIPDVKTGDSCAAAVYKLYRAGILTGSDDKGTFKPTSNIQRSEMATIVTRMADADLRKEVTLTGGGKDESLNAEQIAAKCSSSVFYIEIYDRYGEAIASGSGVFISPDGKALTNHHVVEDAYSAFIQTTDGSIYDVTGWYDAKAETDLALIQVEGSGFDYMELGDVSALAAGQTVFAIGSPLGLDNTISQGIISNPNRVVDGLGYIQTTAPISHGSSGGALINNRGKLIGITSAGFTDGQNLNLAVPVSRVAELSDAVLHEFPLSGGAGEDYGAYMSFDDHLYITDGATEGMLITVDPGTYEGEFYLSFEIADTNVALGDWSEWDGFDITLYITGVNGGDTYVDILMLTSDDDTVLASGTLTVSVTDDVSYGYYSGYYPAPDFGAVAGCDVYRVYDGIYYYDSDEFDINSAFYDYFDALYSNGFEFWKEDTDSNGGPLSYYHNESYDLYVVTGAEICDGAVCYFVLPYYGWEV